MFSSLFYPRRPAVNRNIGVCTVRHENDETQVTCPSVTFVVNSTAIVTINTKMCDNAKIDKTNLGDIITESDGTRIAIDKTASGVVRAISVDSADNNHGYSVDVMPDPLGWLPFMKSTFTKELLFDNCSIFNSTGEPASVYDITLGQPIAMRT